MANFNSNKGVWQAILCLVMGIVIGAAALFGIGYGLDWFSLGDDEEAFSSGNVVLNEGESSGISLQARKLTADRAEKVYSLTSGQFVSGSSYELTVTYNEGATNPSFTWEASSSNVTLTPSADTFSCAVVCSAAFSEQVTVTVTANDNAEAKASCYVDYVKRLTATSGLAMTLNNGAVTISDNGTKDYTLGSTYTATPSYSASASTYGTGSVTEDYTVDYSFYSNVTSSTFSAGSTVSEFIENATGYTPDTADNLYEIYTLCNATTSDVVVTVTFTGSITGLVYTYTYTLELDCSSVYVPVSGITLNETNIYF